MSALSLRQNRHRLLVILPLVAMAAGCAVNELRRHHLSVSTEAWCRLAQERNVFVIKAGWTVVAPSWWPHCLDDFCTRRYVLVSIVYARDLDALTTMPECPAVLFMETSDGVSRTSVANFANLPQPRR